VADGVHGDEVQIRDLQCLIESLGGGKPVLIGAPMGGAVSLGAVGGGHVDARALALVDVGPVIEREVADRVRAFMEQRPDGFDTLDEVAEAIAKNVRIAPNGRDAWHWDPKRLHVARNVTQREARLRECSRNLRLPTLLMRGGLSDVLSEAGARTFLELCPHCEHVNVGDAAHMVAGDYNDVFADAAIDFLSRVEPARDSG